MKHISDIVDLKKFGKYANDKSVSKLNEEKTKKILNRLFVRFERIFPKFWVNIQSQEHLNGIKDEWFECFQRSNIKNIEMLQYGLRYAQECKEEYLPKASTFIKWCTNVNPEFLGFMDYHQAFNIAVKINEQFSSYKYHDKEMDLIIRHAVNKIGTVDFRAMNSESALKIFEHYYTVACRQYLHGELKIIDKALENNKKETEELEKKKAVVKDEFKKVKDRKSAINAMKEMLNK
jgi:hypothetical protein